jgi:hypothetical protein
VTTRARARSSTHPPADGGGRDIPDLPARVDRGVGAVLVTQRYFPVSPRTLEAWPLTWRHVNGKAVCETAELFAVARAKLDAAPPVRGGRHAAGQGA